MNHVVKINIEIWSQSSSRSSSNPVEAIKYNGFPFQSSMGATRGHKAWRGDTCQVNSFYGQRFTYLTSFDCYIKTLHI